VKFDEKIRISSFYLFILAPGLNLKECNLPPVVFAFICRVAHWVRGILASFDYQSPNL
jgi:hypothetical protein